MDIFYPLQLIANGLNDLIDLPRSSYLGSAINFFAYDTMKIGLLLVVINYVMAILRYYFPWQRAREILTKKRLFWINYLIAALLGVITPFCSCSSIPLFIGFLGAGIPLGVTFSFLISSPLINESSLYLFPAMFGLKVTVLYNLFGLVIAVLGGLLIERLRLERYVIPEALGLKFKSQENKRSGDGKIPFRKLAKYFWRDGLAVTRNIFPYVVIGVAIGAAIHGFLPASLAENYLSSESWWAVPLAVLLGAPLYANSVSVIPVMEAMIGKGASLGTALAFMTAIVTLSIPEALILKKVMRWPLLVAFFSITIVGLIIMGYLFNWIF
jgi:uncharacterized membrane protein YraQ (UPF0718 family)